MLFQKELDWLSTFSAQMEKMKGVARVYHCFIILDNCLANITLCNVHMGIFLMMVLGL